MKVTFYGVRGSIPTPGPDYVKYGGNTACVHVQLADGTDIILDAGTGIKKLGDQLKGKTTPIHLLLSHNHWDHIQGFPFFAPIYEPGRQIFITPGNTHPHQPAAILEQMSGSLFPVPHQALRADIQLQPVAADIARWPLASATISRQAMNHPGSGNSYLIEADGVRLAYVTDNELYPPVEKHSEFIQWVKFTSGADLIIHDAQYMLSDMPAKSGWGHSVAEEAVKLAMAARAKRLALYSHDYVRTDPEIEKVEAHCQDILQIAKSDLTLFAAREGQTVDL